MTEDDEMLERSWWVFRLPHGTIAHVPASSEQFAREMLVNTCYERAPVHEWPLIGTRVCTRNALTKSLLRKASPQRGTEGKEGNGC